MVEKLTGKELVIKVLEDSDEPMSCSEICDTAIESKYFKLYARGTDNDQKKAQISSLLSTWYLNDNCPVTRYDKGHDGNSVYTYVLNENVEDEDNESDDEEEYCEECGELIDDCVCENEEDDSDNVDESASKKWLGETTLLGSYEDDENSQIHKNKGRIVINSEPNDVIIEIFNNEYYGYGEDYTTKRFDIKPGTYTIKITKDGYNPFIQQIQINKYQVRNLKCKLNLISKKLNSQILDFENVKSMKERIGKERLKLEEQEKLDKLREENRLRLLQEEKLKNEKIEKQKFEQKQEQERLISEEEENNERLQLESQSSISDCNILPVGRFNKYGNGHGNGNKKIITRARLLNGEEMTWVKLLEKYNLYHIPGRAASDEWYEYKRKDTKGELPDVERIDADGNLIPYVKPNGRTDPVAPSEKLMIWDITFNGKKDKCIACNDLEIAFNGFELGHNIPKSKEGSNNPNNLFPICYRCNRLMGNRYTILEFMKKYFPKTGNVEKYFGETLDKSTNQWIKIENWINPRNL